MSSAPETTVAVAVAAVEAVPSPIENVTVETSTSHKKKKHKKKKNKGSDTPNNDEKNKSINNDPQVVTNRRRLKKLRKTASTLRLDGDTSGIVSPHVWQEIQEIRDKIDENDNSTNKDNTAFCPYVGRRQTRKQQQLQHKIRPGFDHRYILKRLVVQKQQQEQQETTKPGKRSRKDNKNTLPNCPIPNWMTLHNPACVDHVVVLDIQLNSDMEMSNMKDILDKLSQQRNPQLATDNTCISTRWFEGPRPQSVTDVLLYERPPASTSNRKNKKAKLSGNIPMEEAMLSLLLSPHEMETEGYPVPLTQLESQDLPALDPSHFQPPSSISLEDAKTLVQNTHVLIQGKEGVPFVMHSRMSNQTDNSHHVRIFGLDCEMVMTKRGRELGRVTLIQCTTTSASASSNFQDQYKVIMDELVKPYEPILDYCSQYSGLTATLLNPVKTRLEQVQASLLRFIHPTDILVGHSLENDLMVLRWIHPTVVDTSCLFRQPQRSFKYSLKHLTAALLQRNIQHDSTHHCSEEDAAATLELAIRRAQEGPSFNVRSNLQPQMWIPPSSKNNNNNNNNVVFVGPSTWLQEHVTKFPNAIHALACEGVDSPNRKAILSWLTGPSRRSPLIWAQLVIEHQDHVQKLETFLSDLYAKMPINAVILVNLQQGYAKADELCKTRRQRQNPRTTLSWSQQEEKSCNAAIEVCREGHVLWLTKHPGPLSVDDDASGSRA